MNETGDGGLRQRLRSGFTLVEMLVALLIMSLMTGLVAMGIAVSTDIYKKEQFASQSQVLLDTIESALSDPLRFAHPDDDNKPVVVYRNNNADLTFISPDLQARTGSKATRQVLYLNGSNDSEGVPLLNEGIYGDCTVSVEKFEMLSKAGTSSYQTTVKLKVKSTRDDTLTLEREFTFDSQPGVSKEDSFGADAGSGGTPFEPDPEREGTDAPEHLYGGAGTAEESGFPEYSSSLVAADKRNLGNAMTDANAALSELSSQRTAEQVDALRSAISSALSTMVNLRASQGAVNTACDELNAAIAAFRNASSGGNSGGGESGGGSSGGSEDPQEPSYTIKQTAAWDGNRNYGITFRNFSDSWVESVSIEVTAHGNVTGIEGNVTAHQVGGSDKWIIAFSNYGNGLTGNTTYSDVYVHVTGTGDFSIS